MSLKCRAKEKPVNQALGTPLPQGYTPDSSLAERKERSLARTFQNYTSFSRSTSVFHFPSSWGERGKGVGI